MPFLALNRGSKRFGVQTFAKAKALMPELQDAELDYLDLRDWYVNQLSILAQYQEALEQAKAAKNKGDSAEFSQKIHSIESRLVDMKKRVREAGERSWAEAFFLAASHMLPKEAVKAIGMEADRLLGRERHELKGL